MNRLSKLLIVDDHPLFREALSAAVGVAYPFVKSNDVCDLDKAIDVLESDHDYDLALLDLNLPGVQGFDGLLKLRSLFPRLPVLVVSGIDNEQIPEKAIAYGAAGFVPKSLGREVLAHAIDAVMCGEVYLPESVHSQNTDALSCEKAQILKRMMSLTPQQSRVLIMLREGLLNKQIAYELDVGSTTVKKHVSEVLRKLKVNSRTQAVIEVSKLDQDDLFDLQKQFIN
ncbi:MAG: response regulator transcription factor [Granulosicoccus sp.]|nr:response regulator transcription factor [Granulosicoccus sp.]